MLDVGGEPFQWGASESMCILWRRFLVNRLHQTPNRPPTPWCTISYKYTTKHTAQNELVPYIVSVKLAKPGAIIVDTWEFG